MRIHDLERPRVEDLEGMDVRLNEPGGRHFEGVLHNGYFDVFDADREPPPPGVYELAFREHGTTAWANDARLPTVEL